MNRRGFLKAVTAALAGAALGPVLPAMSAPATAAQTVVGADYVALASVYLREMHLLGMGMGEALFPKVTEDEAHNRMAIRRILEGLV